MHAGHGDQPTRGVLLEREDELRVLRDAVTRSGDQLGGVVLLRGPAGSGKTALLDFVRTLAESSGIAVLRARAAEFEREFPFGAVRQLLQPLVRSATSVERDQLFAGAAALARPLFAGDPLAFDDREDRAGAIVEGIAWMITNVAAERDTGVVLEVDDAHACDRASLRALARIALRTDELGVLVVLALRPGEVGAEQDLLDWLAADPATRPLDLQPLSASGMTALIEQRLGSPAAPGFVSACLRVTGGNPFMAHELLGELAAREVLPTEAALSALDTMVPAAVLRAVSARVSRLGRDARALAEAIAVLGAVASLRHGGDLAGLSPEAAAVAAHALARGGIVHDGDPVSFVHPLVAAAVAQDIGTIEVGQAHLRAAKLLADDGAATERIAAHLVLSPPSGDPQAMEVLRSAAAESMRNGVPRGAVPLLRRALLEANDPETRAAVERDLAYAEAAAGEPTAIDRLAKVLGTTVERRERVRTMRELARLQFLHRHQREAALTIQAALGEVGDDPDLGPPLRAEFLGYAGVGSSTLDPDLRQAATDHILQLIAQFQHGTLPQDPGLLIQTASAVAAGRGDAAVVRQLMEQAMAIRDIESLPPYGIVGTTAVVALAAVDELGLADRIAERCWAAALRSESMHDRGQAAFSRALVAAQRGRLDRTIELADTALNLAMSGAPLTLIWSAVLLVDAHRRRGDLAAARRSLTVATRTDKDDVMHGIGISARADLRLAEGRPIEAWDDAHEAAESLDRFGLRDYPIFAWRLTAARAGRVLDRGEQAIRYVEEELEFARTSGVPRSLARALVVRAELADDADAEVAALEEATAALRTSPASLLKGEVLSRLGAAQRRAGDLAGAERTLREALELGQRCAADPLVKRARAELRALGVRPRSARPDGLTRAERRIVELAAAGRSNREIADALHLTVSTVEYHLTRVYRKLGAISRADLRAAMDQESPSEI